MASSNVRKWAVQVSEQPAKRAFRARGTHRGYAPPGRDRHPANRKSTRRSRMTPPRPAVGELTPFQQQAAAYYVALPARQLPWGSCWVGPAPSAGPTQSEDRYSPPEKKPWFPLQAKPGCGMGCPLTLPGFSALGLARPSRTSCPYDCVRPPGPSSSDPAGLSFCPEKTQIEFAVTRAPRPLAVPGDLTGERGTSTQACDRTDASHNSD